MKTSVADNFPMDLQTSGWLEDLLPQGILLTDSDLTVRGWNLWLETHGGHRAEEVIGRPLLEVYPDLRERRLDHYYQSALGGQVELIAHRFHRYLLPMPPVLADSGAEYMQQSARIAPLWQAGHVVGTVTVIEDVSERVSYERDLRRQLVFQTVRAGVNEVLGRATNLQDAVASILRTLGEMLGYSLAALWLLDRRREVLRLAALWKEPGLSAPRLTALPRQISSAHLRSTGSSGIGFTAAELLTMLQTADPPRAVVAAAEGLAGVTAIPCRADGHALGVLELYSANPSGETPEVHTLLLDLMRQVGEFYRRRNAEETLREHHRLATLTGEIGIALTRGGTLPEILQHCVVALVQHLGAAFARIWVLNEKTQVLELQASAGLYTHLDGPHSRVPVGQSRIGVIARQRRPCLTNRLIGDPRIDQEWARREGLIAFAGYPLIVEDRLCGVMALFDRKPLPRAKLDALAAAAGAVALGIVRIWTQESLQASEESLRAITDAAADAVILIDSAGKARHWNPAAEKIFGYAAERFWAAISMRS